MAKNIYIPEKIFLLPLLYAFLIREDRAEVKLTKDTSYIFAANHNSHIDEFVLMPPVVLRTAKVTHFFADRKHWFEGKLPFRFLAWRFQAIPIDRGKGSAEAALKRGVELLEKGDNVIIYPEGTRGEGIHLTRGKVGVAKLALWSGRPVVPVGVWGTHRIMPKGVHFPRVRRIVRIRVGKPMTFGEYRGRKDDPATLREITDRIMMEIGRLIDEPYDPSRLSPRDAEERGKKVDIEANEFKVD